MRNIKSLNYDWQYEIQKSGKSESVDIPHTNIELPYSYINENDYQFKSQYKKAIEINYQDGKKYELHFYGVATNCKIFAQGELVLEHFGGYDAFFADITKFAKEKSKIEIIVQVDSTEDKSVPPFGNVIDYLTYGGIYREVQLIEKPIISLENPFLCPVFKDNKYTLDVCFDLQSTQKYSYNLLLNDNIISTKEYIKGKTDNFEVGSVEQWDINSPKLYNAKIQLLQNGNIIDEIEEKIGFRTCEFKSDGFYLNRKKLKLRGLNRHQSFPYIGYAMPKSMQVQDADIIKKELACNIVRTSHYMQSKHFLNRCDEIGLLVFTEIPGWQHVSKLQKWRDLVLKDTKSMILQYRNHPSIIIWGVRINESQDDNELYTKTNSIAKKLDPSRATGGVRFITKSNLLEDVYTYNDFSHTGDNLGLTKKSFATPDMKKAYLVTEYNGHMYPTKTFDDETHRTNHALRHANVLDEMYAQEDIAGCIGWCMADYNTHKDFGSGDKICHHGVLNMFRMPKLAAGVYGAFRQDKPVLEISSMMLIGEYPKGQIGQIAAFTNCDSVKLYKNSALVKEFKQSDSLYKSIPVKPIIIDDLIGNLIHENENFAPKTADKIKALLLDVIKHGFANLPLRAKLNVAALMAIHKMSFQDAADLYGKYVGNWGDSSLEYTFVGVKDGKEVISKNVSATMQTNFEYKTSHTVLEHTDTYDVAQIFITAKDQNENRLPYYFAPVSANASEGLKIIGPSVISMLSGQASFYVRSTKTCENAKVEITIGNCKHEINFKVR